jgi:hypothetical protein
MRQLLLVWIHSLIINVTYGQSFSFQRTYGGNSDEKGYFLLKTFDNGCLLVGNSTSFSFTCEAYMVKTDYSGNILWSRCYGDSVFYSFCDGFQLDDGGYLLAGKRNFTSSILLSRFDSIGNPIWYKEYSNPNIFYVTNSLIKTKTGDCIVCASSNISSQKQNIFLIKLNTNGDTLWTRSYIGTNSESANSIVETPNGELSILGTTSSFGQNEKAIFLIHTDSIGTVLWNKSYGTTGGEEGYSIEATSDSGYVILGCSGNSIIPIGNILLLKTDKQGNLLWNKTFGSTEK